ncbi:MAG: polysaccharide deacetylase family protein [Clostridia bacterium]
MRVHGSWQGYRGIARGTGGVLVFRRFGSAMGPWALRVRRLLWRSGLASRSRARRLAGVALLAMAAVGALVSRGEVRAEPRASEIALLPGTYEETLDVMRRPDTYVFGFIRDGSMMVPVRPTASAYGATVHWVAGVGTLVDGHLIETVVVLGQAYSPARELATILGCWIEWDEASRTVVLSNGIQRVVVSVPASAWSEELRALPGEGQMGGAGNDPGAGDLTASGAVPGLSGSVPGTGAETGRTTAAGAADGASGLAFARRTGASAATPGAITVTQATPGPDTLEADTLHTAGVPSGVPQAGLPVVTIASVPSAAGPTALGASRGGSGGEAPVVVITPAPIRPALPPGEDPDGGGTAPRSPGRRLSAGRIALTFDDGPDAVYTKKILSVLDRYGVKATFFLIGSQVERHPAVVREVAAAGHELGNHGYSHSRLTTLPPEAVRREISKTQEAVKAAANVTPKWFRPAYGSYDEEIRRIAKDEGATTVLWTLNPDDWQNPGQSAIVQRVTSAAADGAIVLLHVREQTARALPGLIEELRSQGFELVRLCDIFATAGGKNESPARAKASAGATGGEKGVPAASEGGPGASGGGTTSAGGVTDGPQATPGASGMEP